MLKKNNPVLFFKIRFCIGFILSLFGLPLWAITEIGISTYHYIIPVVCLMQMYLIYRLKNTPMLLMSLLYLFIYFIYLIPYYYNGAQLSEYTQYQNPLYYNRILYIFYMFYSGITLASSYDFNPYKHRLKNMIKINTQKPITIIYILFLFILIIFVYRQGENVLKANVPYMAYKENLENANSLPIFCILFILFLPFIIKNIVIKNILFNTFIVAISYFSITRGFRMVFVPMIFLIYLYYIDMKIKTKYMIIAMILGFVFMGYINSLKMNTPFEIYNIFSENDKFILSHHADNLYGSAVGMGLIDNGTITYGKRTLLSIGWISEIIIPPTFLPNYMKYPHIINSSVQTGGGGLFITGAYMMWGGLGVLIFGFLFAQLVRLTYKKQNSILSLITTIILIFSARWISYDFHIILRFSLIGLFIYYFLNNTKIKYNK